MTGKYRGKRLTVLSTGIGTDNIDIVMNELDALCQHRFQDKGDKAGQEVPEHTPDRHFRSGNKAGHSYRFVRVFAHFGGLRRPDELYAGRDSISIADMEEAFKKHTGWAKHLPDPYFVKAGPEMISRFEDCTVRGMTIAAPGFYGPQGRVLRMPLAMPDMLDTFGSFRYGDWRITNFEMEGSAIAGNRGPSRT